MCVWVCICVCLRGECLFTCVRVCEVPVCVCVYVCTMGREGPVLQDVEPFLFSPQSPSWSSRVGSQHQGRRAVPPGGPRLFSPGPVPPLHQPGFGLPPLSFVCSLFLLPLPRLLLPLPKEEPVGPESEDAGPGPDVTTAQLCGCGRLSDLSNLALRFG